MPFVRLAFFPGGTAEQYAVLSRELAGAPVPSGRLVLAAGPVDGGWQVVQIWDRQNGLDAFNQQWLVPAMRRAGGAGLAGPPVVRDFQPADLEVSGSEIR